MEALNITYLSRQETEISSMLKISITWKQNVENKNKRVKHRSSDLG